MAQRRMFSKEITTSDLFVDMPASTQLLYFHLGMEADDEGFIGNARMLGRAYGASNDDLKLLQAKGFIIVFESGVTVVKDWNVNNKLRKDRFKPTIYQDEKNLLAIMDTGTYEIKHLLQESQQRSISEKPVVPMVEETGIQNDNQMSTKWQPNDNQMTTQYRIGKDRIGKDRIGKDRLDEDRLDTPRLIIASHCQTHGLFIDGQQLQILEDFHAIDGMHIDVICRAVTEAADNGKRNLKYILAILRNWKRDGIETLVQVEERERQRIERRVKSSGNSHQPSNVPSWSNPDYKEEPMTAEDEARLQRIQHEILEKLDGGQ